MQNIPEIVKNVIIEELKKHNTNVEEIYLFGSRATGNYNKDSDWDFFVVVDKELSFQEKWDIIDKIKIVLAKLKIPNDILIKSKKELIETKDDFSTITYYAVKEGVPI